MATVYTISLYMSALLFGLSDLIASSDPSKRKELIADFSAQTGVSEHDIEQLLKEHPPTRRPPIGKPAVTARITRCRDGQPLVVLPDRPFNGLEICPNDLQRLGERLCAIARLAKQHKGKQPTTVVMS